MKTRQDKFKNTSDFQGRRGSATLNMEKLSLFMDSMISNYNSPELAVLREWISNAHDAHVAAGIKRPVKVALPSALNPMLTVEDFGLGMTSDFVENSYLSFGTSTKDLANDEIGGFGQGGKSALAIAAQYMMTTISEGLKNIYIFERSPMGGVDFKLVVENEPTDEPSGTLVQVAVDRIGEFTEKNLNRVLAGWSNADIELNTGKKFFSIPDNGTEVSFEIDVTDLLSENARNAGEIDIRTEKGYVLDGAFDLSGGGKGLANELGLSWDEYVVLVGPVAYIFQPQVSAKRVLKDYMVASVAIGDVSFPSSREVIEPTRNNRMVVGRTLEGIVAEADKLLQERADSITDRRAALALHRSPLVRNAKGFKISFKGEVIPTTFTPKASDELFEYEHIGNWRGVKNYKLSEKRYAVEATLKLNIETLIIKDLSDVSTQSIRNNVRVHHTVEGHEPKDLNGYLVIAEKPSPWLKAAARTVLKASELAEKAKTYRKEQRELAAANRAAGIVPVATVRKTRKDRIGEYAADWLSFEDENGDFKVSSVSGRLMDFYTEVYDTSKTLVLTTNDGEITPGSMVSHFNSFGIDPQDAQFLRVHTGSRVETLRILLGTEDEVTITDLYSWMKENFAELAQFNGRAPQEIAAEIPFDVARSVEMLFDRLGLDTIHPKYSEIMESHRELQAAKTAITGGGYYYDPATRLVRQLLEGHSHSDAEVSDRPEFFFLSQLNYWGDKIGEENKPAIRHALNQMVEHWLDNLALEEAEAEDLAEAEAKTAQDQQKHPVLSTAANSN